MASERHRLFAVATLVACTLVGPAARAQSLADRETARDLMDEGYAALAHGDAKTALQRFTAADALVHAPTSRLAVAKAEVALGQLLEARESALEILREPSPPNEPRPFVRARAEARTLSDDLADRIPALRIVVHGDAGAAVSVDGVEVPAASLITPRRLDPGMHHVVARDGDRHAEADVKLAEHETRDVVLELPAEATSAPGSPPSSPPPVPAEPAPAEPPAAGSSGNAWKTVAWIGFGVGVAGIGAGAVTGLLAMSAKSSADAGCVANRCPPATYPDLDRASTFGNVSTIAFVIGGAGAVLGGVSWWLAASRDAHGPSTAVVVGPGSIALVGRL